MKCLRCDRDLPLYARGNCASCYHALRAEVASRRETWESLERKGWVAPPAKRGPSTKPVRELREKPYEAVCTECGFTTTTPEASFNHRKESGHLLKLREEPLVESTLPTSPSTSQ